MERRRSGPGTGPIRKRLEGRRQAAVGEDGGVKPTGELPELLEGLLQILSDPLEQCLDSRRIVVEALLGHPQVERERDEALLRAVVEVAFESPSFRDACLHDSGSRVSDLLEL